MSELHIREYKDMLPYLKEGVIDMTGFDVVIFHPLPFSIQDNLIVKKVRFDNGSNTERKG